MSDEPVKDPSITPHSTEGRYTVLLALVPPGGAWEVRGGGTKEDPLWMFYGVAPISIEVWDAATTDEERDALLAAGANGALQWLRGYMFAQKSVDEPEET